MIMRRNLNGTAMRSDHPRVRRARVPHPRQPARHRAALESSAAPVHLSHAVPADDDRRDRADRLGGQRVSRSGGDRGSWASFEGAFAAGAITLSCLLVFGWMYESLPFDGRATSGDTTVYAWGPFRKPTTAGRAVADGWTRYNMLGYEGRPAYPEYHDVVDDDGRDRSDQRVRSGAVGEQRGQRAVRHDDGVDAAAALDRRLHRLDGGALLRGVRHHAVPLPDHGGDVQAVVQSGSPVALRRTTTQRSACSTWPISACAI